MPTLKLTKHSVEHHMAGKSVLILRGALAGEQFMIEDWWDRVGGQSWRWAQGNPACMIYGIRIGTQIFRVPPDDEVLYGKINRLGHLVHVKEIE